MISMVCCARNTFAAVFQQRLARVHDQLQRTVKQYISTDILPHSVEFRVMGVQMLRDGLHEQVVMLGIDVDDAGVHHNADAELGVPQNRVGVVHKERARMT